MSKKAIILIIIGLIGATVVVVISNLAQFKHAYQAYQAAQNPPPKPNPEAAVLIPDRSAALTLTSPAFSEGENIPEIYTCDGANISPPLQIDQVATPTASLALILTDPEAPSGEFVHWLLFNLNPDTRIIPEAAVPSAAVQAANSLGENGYTGPCPPTGTHRYEFQLYTLDTHFNLPPATTKSALIQAMNGHILESTILTGTYAR